MDEDDEWSGAVKEFKSALFEIRNVAASPTLGDANARRWIESHARIILQKGQKMTERAYRIDGYPVTRQEVLDQATMISGTTVYSLSTAKRVLKDDGRDVENITPKR